MKVDCKYKIEKVASTDETRSNLTAPYFDAKKKLLIATDGHTLVAVPADSDEGEKKSGYIDVITLQAERKRARSRGVKIDAPDARKFPDWEQVVPKSPRGEDGTVTLAFDLQLLRNIADAIGCSKLELTVTLDPKRPAFAADGFPIHVRGDSEEIAVLMPLRIKEPTP